MKVAITGVGTWLGQNVLRHLREIGHEVMPTDFDDDEDRALVFPPCDGVVHLAGLYGAAISHVDPVATYMANVSDTLHVLAAMQRADCHYLVLASAAEAAAPATSPFAASKRIVEGILPTIDAAYPLSYFAMRLTEVVGPGDRGSLLARAVAAAKGGPALVVPRGLVTRDFVHVSDVCDFVARALTLLPYYHLNGVIDVGSGVPTALPALLTAIEAVVGSPVPTTEPPEDAPLETPTLVAQIAQARVMLGWQPSRTFADMVAEATAAAAERMRA